MPSTAIKAGHLEVVRLLLESKADKDKASRRGVTPMFLASQKGHADVVRLLLDFKADKDRATSGGATPIFIAKQEGHEEVVQLLREATNEWLNSEVRCLREVPVVYVSTGKGQARSWKGKAKRLWR